MGGIKEVCGYPLAVGTSVGVCQPHVLDDWVLTVAQIPGLNHESVSIPVLFIVGIRGPALPLSSFLNRKITLSLASSVWNLCPTAFHKPPATRSCVPVWAWLPTDSLNLCKCSSTTWEHFEEPVFSRWNRSCTQTWWDGLNVLPWLRSVFALG